MKIISKFHDYYDGVQAQGFDDGLVMMRITVEHHLDEPRKGLTLDDIRFKPLIDRFSPDIFSKNYYDQRKHISADKLWHLCSLEVIVVLFVGRPYVGYKLTRARAKSHDHYSFAAPVTDVRYIYDLVELDKFLVEHGANSIYNSSSKPRWSWRATPKIADAYHHATEKTFINEASELNAPIIQMHRDMCVTYPSLKDIQFFKALDPWQTYQELSMFLGNIAAPDNCPVTVSDKDRIQQHGFDKHSFRTRKNE